MKTASKETDTIASPYRLFFTIIVTVFSAEAIIMAILSNIHLEPIHGILLDATILIAITFPFLYKLVYKPITIVAEEREALIVKLENALADVRTLSGLLPICTHCKKVRNDQGFWDEVEHYISTRSEAKFSHGICPSCIKERYPEDADEILEKLRKGTH